MGARRRDLLWPWLVASALVHALLVAQWADLRPVAAPPPAQRDTTTVHLRLAPPPPVPEVLPESPPEPVLRPPEPEGKPVEVVAPKAREPVVELTEAPAPPPPPRPVEEPPEEIVEPTVDVAATTPTPEALPSEIDSAALAAAALASYVEVVRARVAAHQRYPSMARRRGLEGSVRVALEIAADGSLTQLHVGDGTVAILARATRTAVEQASPFPAPPNGGVTIEVPVRYDLTR